MHHTKLKDRKINVELTAGGGGKGEARRKKLAEKKKRLITERVWPDEVSGELSMTTARSDLFAGTMGPLLALAMPFLRRR